MQMKRIDSSIAERLRQPADGSRSQDFAGDGPGPEAAGDRLAWMLLGASVAVRQLRWQIQRIAPYFRTALIRGEPGAGKEAVARAIHAHSPGADGRFVVANASALGETAGRQRIQELSAAAAVTLESAEGGTLFLECVGDLSFEDQSALFRLLRPFDERSTAAPDGSREGTDGREPQRREPGNPDRQGKNARTGARIIAASDRDLRTLAAVGQFRQDLYARLSGVEIFVPPLRQRAEDIPELADRLLERFAGAAGTSRKAFADTAIAQLQQWPWPNNLRELERVVEQAAALAEDGVIEPGDLLTLVGAGPVGPDAAAPVRIECLHEVVQRYVLEVLTRCGGNKVRAAELLGISRSTLYRMLGTEQARDL